MPGDDATQRSKPADAHRLARRRYLAGQPLDLPAMARELNVNRATLYRWVKSRDQLFADTAWSLAADTMEAQWCRLAGEPGPRVPALVGGFLRAVLAQEGGRKVALEHNDRMMRTLTFAEYGFQPRFVEALRGFLAEDLAEGRIASPLDVDELAYACARIAESYMYLPTIAGREPDPDTAEKVLNALLHP